MEPNILIITDRPSQDQLFPASLRDLISEQQAGDLERVTDLLVENKPKAAILDIDSLPKTGRHGYGDIVDVLRTISSRTRIIALTSASTPDITVRLAENGVVCLPLPTTFDQINAAIQSALNQPAGVAGDSSLLVPGLGTRYPTMFKTRSPVMRRMLDKVALVSRTETTILLTGETGTGKGVIARLIHDSSPRSGETMMSVHCGAIPDSLIESELFGHVRGSFTGAIKNKMGKFEQASKGTIFLDEIGTITAATQIKLLQVLQDRTFQPIGSQRTHTTDVRIIAASNSDLEEMANKGEFRADLYYRLNIFPIEVPPLRERREDISLFVEYFLARFNEKHSKRIIGLTDEMLNIVNSYNWPGNVRELENMLERAHILAESPYLDRSLFPADMCSACSPADGLGLFAPVKTLAQIRNEAVQRAEKEYLCSLLTIHKGRIEATARSAGVSRRQIHKLLTKYNIKKEHYKPSRQR